MTTEKTKRSFLQTNLTRAASRKKQHGISIDVDYLYKLGEQQQWKCALTGIDLEFTRGGQTHGKRWINPHSCSIDRIDTTSSYSAGNVQLVCAVINDMKSFYSQSDLIKYATAIASYNTPKTVPVQLTIPGITAKPAKTKKRTKTAKRTTSKQSKLAFSTVSARTAAKITGKSRTVIHKAINSGKLKAVKSKTKFAISQLDLAAWAKSAA